MVNTSDPGSSLGYSAGTGELTKENSVARTNQAAVQELLMDDYGAKADGTFPTLRPFIDTASSLVDKIVAQAPNWNMSVSTADQELIERWLAAHFYVQSDQPYAGRSTERGSGQFQGQPNGLGLENSKYGKAAMNLDYSGTLSAINKRAFARAQWLGKNPSDQIPIWERD